MAKRTLSEWASIAEIISTTADAGFYARDVGTWANDAITER